MEILPLILGSLTAFFAFLIAINIPHRWERKNWTPKVSIVIAARNEENSIFDTLMSIDTQDYPEDKIKLILVDHLSDDATGEIMDDYAKIARFETKVIHVTDEEDSELHGKAQALDIGMQHVDTEFVLFTDGDVIVPERWARTLVSYFNDDVAAVGGLVDTDDQKANLKWVSRLQHIDHRYYLGVQTGLSGLAGSLDNNGRSPKRPLAFLRGIFKPSFCMGNNMAYRLDAYKAVGGYKALGKTVIEDYSMLRRIVHKTGKHLAMTRDNDARIKTIAQPDMPSLIEQKLRWSASTGDNDTLSFFLYMLIIINRMILIWLLFFYPLQVLIVLLANFIFTCLIIYNTNHISGIHIRLRELILFEIYQILLNHYLLFGWITKSPVKWKGKIYER